MKKYIKYTLIYLSLLLIALYLLFNFTTLLVENRNFNNWETDSNLLIFKKGSIYDLLFMGISHARNFSRHKNHLEVERILNKSLINIGQGGGSCGVNEQLFYLDYFYYKKNSVDTVVYFISPPLFFSDDLPVASNTFDYESFRLDFLYRYIMFPAENKFQRIASYLQSKINPAWIFHKPESEEAMSKKLVDVDLKAVIEGQKAAYSEDLNLDRFGRSAKRVKDTIVLSLKNGSEMILIIPPALFGKWNGHELIVQFGKKMEAMFNGVQFYDLSESVMIPELYYDHHHLNTAGVIYFSDNFLKPILEEGQKQ